MNINPREQSLKWWSSLTDKQKDIEAVSYFYNMDKKNKGKNDLTDYDIEQIYKNWILTD